MTDLPADLGRIVERQMLRDDPGTFEWRALEVAPLCADLEEPAGGRATVTTGKGGEVSSRSKGSSEGKDEGLTRPARTA
jgi:hypothetical protein